MIKAPFWRTTMPTYHIEMLEGRTVEQKRLLAEKSPVSRSKSWADRPIQWTY
jgi:hypothetical protein